jgi:Thaumatin family
LYRESGNSSLTEIPPNLTNPVCIGTAALLASQGSTQDLTLGTNLSFPLPLDQSQSNEDVSRWCPWDLQLSPPQKPGDGVYPYPDDNIQRPQFDPCYSACAKFGDPADCCTGSYDSPQVCKPSYYSTQAKSVCPDAYSFAFDDQTSTFIIPSGGGFQIIFCPPGRSTNILATLGPELRQLAQSGHVSEGVLAGLSNESFIEQQRSAASKARIAAAGIWVLLAWWVAWFAVWT